MGGVGRVAETVSDALESDGYEVIGCGPLRFTSEGGVEGGVDPGQDGVALAV